MIAYCWHSVPGYSSFAFTGNGNADGPFIYTGHSVAWVMVKATNATQDWIILNSAMDVYNPAVDNLSPNQTSGPARQV